MKRISFFRLMVFGILAFNECLATEDDALAAIGQREPNYQRLRTIVRLADSDAACRNAYSYRGLCLAFETSDMNGALAWGATVAFGPGHRSYGLLSHFFLSETSEVSMYYFVHNNYGTEIRRYGDARSDDFRNGFPETRHGGRNGFFIKKQDKVCIDPHGTSTSTDSHKVALQNSFYVAD